MAVYAIKVWLSKSENDWFLYKDLEDNVIHTWSRREKAEEALARSTEKKQKLKMPE